MAVVTHRLPRLYVEHELDGDSVALDERESHYLGHVLRLERGDRARHVQRPRRRAASERRGGATARCPCSRLQRRMNRCRNRASTSRCVQALPKSDAMDLIVQKADGARRAHARPRVHGIQRRQARRRTQRAAFRALAQDRAERVRAMRPPPTAPHRAAGTARGCARGAAGGRLPLRARPVGRAGVG